MSILEIVELCVLAAIILALIIYYSIKAIKNNWLEKLTEAIEAAIKEAEETYTEEGSGEQKKAFVLQKVQLTCEELGIPYSLLKSLISKFIDKIIANYNVIAK